MLIKANMITNYYNKNKGFKQNILKLIQIEKELDLL